MKPSKSRQLIMAIYITVNVCLLLLFAATHSYCAEVVGFTLINADTDQDLDVILDGEQIDLDTLPTVNLNIRADTDPTVVGSVEFRLNGSTYRIENTAPYALAGDSTAEGYLPWTPAIGEYTLTAIPYTLSHANGDAGTALTIGFSVIRSVGNSPPTAVDDNRFTAKETAVVIDVLQNDYDVDGDNIGLHAVEPPTYGTVVVNSDDTVTYTPDPGFEGNDGFIYSIVDDNMEFDTATVAITVMGDEANLPPEAEFVVSPISGQAPLDVSFDASASTDPDGSIVNYAWDFGDDSDDLVYPLNEWEERSPESQGVDPAKLDQALGYVQNNTGSDGIGEVVIVRNGYVIWKGQHVNTVHSISSVTKVITSTILGLLVDDGDVAVNSMAEQFAPELSDAYADVTLHHFASFTSGYDAQGWSPWGKDPDYDFGDGSVTPWIPAAPLFPPATAFSYWDDAANMMAYVLTRAAQEPLETIFKRRVADEIGMDAQKWGWNDFGTVNGIILNGGGGSNGAGIYISAMELARFGLLYLYRGQWNDTQLISAAWIDQSTRNQVSPRILLADTYRYDLDGRGRYGYHWWTNGITPEATLNLPDAPSGAYYRTGYNDNFLIVVPEWNMVIVRLGLDETIPTTDTSTFLNGFLKIMGEGTTSSWASGVTTHRTFTLPGEYTVSLSVTDDDGETDKTSVAITVNPVNARPVAVPDSYATDQGAPLYQTAPGVLANDSDGDGDPLTAVMVDDVANGILTLNPDGGFSYTPDPGFAGSDTFSYMANDGNLDSPPADVAITVNGCMGDFEPDGDIDGLDLSNLSEGQGSISIADFAENFGKIGCP